MRIKIIQLNIWKGKLFENAVKFLKEEKPDVITLQEVTGGRENLYEDKAADLFVLLKKRLDMNGAFMKCHTLKGDQDSFMGNAVFTTGEIISENAVWLKEFAEVVTEDERDHARSPRGALDCLIELGGKRVHAISAHAAWTRDPVDTAEKIRQAKVLARHLRNLNNEPYLLGGDFNMPRETKTLALIESASRNIVADPRWQITRSTHPTIHKIAQVVPQGLLVDFIFTSPHFTPLSVDVPVIDASDHLPIRAVLKLN